MIVLVVAIGALVGTINGLLVTRVGIDPFIASLGVGTFLYGISLWYSPYQIVGLLPREFTNLPATRSASRCRSCT